MADVLRHPRPKADLGGVMELIIFGWGMAAGVALMAAIFLIVHRD
jgi:hypothetical protein